MAINDSAVVPLYQQVKDDIRAAIESGKYKTNEKIPPEPELSAEYSVSRITVRRAVEELCAEGYLVKMQGRGTFVSKPRIHRKFTSGRGTASFTETCKENGMVPGARLLNRQIVPVRKIKINQKAQKMPPRVEPGGIFVIAAHRRARPYYRRNTRPPRCTAGRARSDPPP